MEQKPWNGVEFMDKFIAQVEKGLDAMKQDHASQKVCPTLARLQQVVMYVTACHKMAIRCGIDRSAYAKALKEAQEKAQAEELAAIIVNKIINGA
jgi:hypothetical protein